ncbi:hypothetical protein SO802_021712 [Lithocarpus litseifolius]|uniref:Aminotransferase-like plant mobile domain-containing protein n=1 Tax=Lithocarpus litseifolius TaxID=425828 RepID=A0AAW2CFW2_9ROSI
MAEKLLIASFHMELEASIWFEEAEEAGVFSDWETLVQALHVRFGSTAYYNPLEVLTRLRQTTTVAGYKAEFEAVSNRIKGLSPLHKLSCFLSGLKDEIRLPVRMLNPQSLNAAFGLAKIQEEYVMSCRRSVNYQQDSGKNSISGLPKSNGSNGMVETKPSIPIKRITPAQMDEMRKKGLCYNCDEKWGPRHKCRNVKLFLLGGIELDYGENCGVKITELDEEVDSEERDGKFADYCNMRLKAKIMAAANAGQINHADPGPIDRSVLTQQPNHRSEVIWNGQDSGSLTCCSRNEEFSNREPMVDDRVVDIIKAVGLEGLLRLPGREIDHGLITALVERWRPETHTFHMPYGEVTITLQDVEVLLGLPVDGEAITGSTEKIWVTVCQEFLGFQPVNNERKQLDGQRILIKRLLEQVADALPPNADEDQVHKYARCYILALLGDTIFVDKSGDRVHLMWVQQLEDLRNPRRYSWGSACLAWLYRELCRASDKKASQIGGCLLLVQYWAWARFPYLCPAVERGPPVGAYGLPVCGPLSLKWVWGPSKKNRPAHIFRDRYRQQIASMLPGQVVWQPYEADLEDLPPWCVAGRAVWTATVPLVCFHLVELHTPDRVVRQFGMIQEIPRDVDTNIVLHRIDLRGKVGVNWMQRHAMHIIEWGNRLQRRCEAVLGDMPAHHEYFDWFKRITRRFIDVPGARLIIMIEGYVRLLRRHPVGTEDHKDIIDVLQAVQEIGRVQPPDPEAPNEEAATPAAAATPIVCTTESPSTSTAPAGRPPVATPQVFPTPNPSSPTPHPSSRPTIHSPIPHPPPSPTIPSPIPHPPPSPTIPSPISHPPPSPTIPSPISHPPPSPTIPSPTPHPPPSPTIPSPIPHPPPSPTIPSPISHPPPSPTIPSPISHPPPSPTIPSPTPHPPPSPTIPSPIPHPPLSRTIPSPTPHPSSSLTIPHLPPSPTIPSPTPHPSSSPTIPSPIPYPPPSPTIPSPTPHPPPSPTIPSPTPSLTIHPATPHPGPRSDIRPPTPRSFPELSPISSFSLGIEPTPHDMQQDPPSHSTPTSPSPCIDPLHVQAEQAVGLPVVAEGRPKRISKAPPCGTGGHKHGHQAGPEASDEGHARPPPHYTRKRKVNETVGTLAGGGYSNKDIVVAVISEVLLRDPSDENVVPVVEELLRRLPPANAIPQGLGDGKEYPGGQNDVDAGEEDESPFEFRALEVALEASCSFLAARTTELETNAYPALDELTSMISRFCLDRVRKLKSAMTRLTARVQKVRDELEQLLDDDDDMADLYLSRKLAGVSSPVSGSGAANWFPASPTIGSKISRASRASVVTVRGDENDVEELEMLKILELAKDANDLVEQQRASTQLGRTYHEMFLRGTPRERNSTRDMVVARGTPRERKCLLNQIAIEANLPSVQLSALENMHYSLMIRFDNVEEARILSCISYLIAVKSKSNSASHDCKFQEVSATASKCATRSCNPVNIGESAGSYKSKSPNVATPNGKLFRSSSSAEVLIASDFAASGFKCDIDLSGNLLPKHDASNLKLHTSCDKHDVSVAKIMCTNVSE